MAFILLQEELRTVIQKMEAILTSDSDNGKLEAVMRCLLSFQSFDRDSTLSPTMHRGSCLNLEILMSFETHSTSLLTFWV